MPTTNFIWDELSDNVLLETDESDVVTAAYHHRPEQFGELISQHRNGVDRFFHFDGKHSTSDLTAGNEKVTDTFSYTAFGEEVARTGATTNPFGYKGAVGYYTNSETNDIYVRNRTSALGRWLSQDPLGFIDGPNLFRAYFVPSAIDPDGTIKRINFDESDKPPKCMGEKFGIAWAWELDKEAKLRGGYIVQHVNIEECEILDCDPSCGCPMLGAGVSYDFYEAWFIEQKKKHTKKFIDNNKAHDDFHFMLAEKDKCGKLKASLEVRYYRISHSMEVKNWKDNLVHGPPSCNNEPKLPSRGKEPPFWRNKKPVEVLKYETKITFNCCPGQEAGTIESD